LIAGVIASSVDILSWPTGILFVLEKLRLYIRVKC
jgi:hypothetical protein